MPRARIFLWLEFLALFAGGPVAVALTQSRPFMITLLWGGALCAWLWWRRQPKPPMDAPIDYRITFLLARFALCTAALVLIVWQLAPELLWNFVRRTPERWAFVIVIYPLLSVLPQEILYRAFFYERYKPLFTHRNALIATSAISFGLMHAIFGNWIAVVLSAGGGFMFSRTYMHTRSLMLVSAEHALYGIMVFTVGLGQYFYSGAAWR